MTFCACTSAGETARASSSTVSSPAAAVSCGRNPMVAFFSIAIVPLSGETSPRRSANKVDLPAPLGPTNPIRSPRLTWSDTSSKSARPANDFESCETVSITESAQCSLVRCPAQLVTCLPRRNEVKAGRAVASEGGSTLNNQLCQCGPNPTAQRQKRMGVRESEAQRKNVQRTLFHSRINSAHAACAARRTLFFFPYELGRVL